MNGVLLALLLIIGVGFLAVGLVIVTLPLLTTLSVSLPGLVAGGACIVIGALTLWVARMEGNQEISRRTTSNRPFFATLGLVNIAVATLSVREGQWPSFLVSFAAGIVVVLLIKTFARQRTP